MTDTTNFCPCCVELTFEKEALRAEVQALKAELASSLAEKSNSLGEWVFFTDEQPEYFNNCYYIEMKDGHVLYMHRDGGESGYGFSDMNPIRWFKYNDPPSPSPSARQMLRGESAMLGESE